MTVHHKSGMYEIRFLGLMDALGGLPPQSFIVSDATVLKTFGGHLDRQIPTYTASPGESSKSPQVYLEVIDWLASNGAQRDAVIIALGGGVVGDLAGFVAATFMRGVAYIQIPTTLLAQVDSSVGGKVGVDLQQGKNMLGSFYAPREVRVAIQALGSLPPRQLANGMAEVLKYGFIMAPEILDMAREDGATEALVRRCIECKRDVVEADELEKNGRRAILNFGHSIGHALELKTGFKDLLHGEAISIGMCVECKMSELLGLSPPGTHQRVTSCLAAHDLPVSHPLLKNGEELIEIVRRDKKSIGGKLAFSLLKGIGQCELQPDVPESVVMESLVQ